jgi:hypothetical protein
VVAATTDNLHAVDYNTLRKSSIALKAAWRICGPPYPEPKMIELNNSKGQQLGNQTNVIHTK